MTDIVKKLDEADEIERLNEIRLDYIEVNGQLEDEIERLREENALYLEVIESHGIDIELPPKDTQENLNVQAKPIKD